MKLLVLNGPNLNLLGTREPGVYGSRTLADIENRIMKYCAAREIACACVQSNHEGELIDQIHAAMTMYDGIVLNAGAYSHYSYAIRDAVASVHLPVVEVHLSNIYARDEFRRHSVLSAVCAGVICGFGEAGYLYAVDALQNLIG